MSSWDRRQHHVGSVRAVTGADLVMICSPVSTYGAIMETIAPGLKAGAIVTDVGSVKAQWSAI